jgi:hypothetical protein
MGGSEFFKAAVQEPSIAPELLGLAWQESRQESCPALAVHMSMTGAIA